MLPKQNRLKRKDFAPILESRRFNNSPHFSLRVGVGLDKPVIAVSVSKKVSKLAVDRNRLRRRVYSALSPHINNIKPLSYLFVSKPSAKMLKGEKLSNELSELLIEYKRG